MIAAAELRERFAGHTPGLLGAKREYAVLCPVLEGAEGLRLLFEVRAATLRRQPGEVCFPGGRMEPGESAVDCALRETEEELTISRDEIQVLGTPDFICNQAGFLLRPVLGLVSQVGMAMAHPSPAEVEEIFTVPLRFFAETPPERYAYDLVPGGPKDFPYEQVGVPEDYHWSRGRVEVPLWFWEKHAIWGMTGRLVEDLVCSPSLYPRYVLCT